MKRYHEATTYLCDRVEDSISADGQIDFPNSTFASSVFMYSKHIEIRHEHTKNRLHPDFESSRVSYYDIHPAMTWGMVSLARIDGDFFDFCSELCAFNIKAGKALPGDLRDFASSILIGVQKRPTVRSRPRKKNWLERSFIWSLTLEAVEDYSLQLTRNDATSEHYSACDAMAEALTVCGRKTNYTEIKNLMIHPDNARLRQEFEASRNIMARWWKFDPPQNALSKEYWDFWIEAARADVMDILRTFPSREENCG